VMTVNQELDAMNEQYRKAFDAARIKLLEASPNAAIPEDFGQTVTPGTIAESVEKASTSEDNTSLNWLKAMFDSAGKQASDLYKSSLGFLFTTKGLGFVTEVDTETAALLNKQAKLISAGTLQLRLRSGLSEEEIELFTEYKKMYPEYQWQGLNGAGSVTVNAQELTGNPEQNGPSDSMLQAVSLFIANSNSLTASFGESVFQIGISYPMAQAIEAKTAANGYLAFPMQFSQVVDYPKLVSVEIKCQFNWSTYQKVTSFIDKRPGGYEHISLQGLNGDEGELYKSCSVVKQDGSALTNEEKAAVDATQNAWHSKYLARKMASVAVKNSIFRSFVEEHQVNAERAFPVQTLSKLKSILTKECKAKIIQVCDFKLPGGFCADWDNKEIQECKDVPKMVQEFYEAEVPLFHTAKKEYQDGFSQEETFTFDSNNPVSFPISFGNDVCVKFTGNTDTGNTSCDFKTSLAAKVESTKDTKTIFGN
jgi:hypothetical protein